MNVWLGLAKPTKQQVSLNWVVFFRCLSVLSGGGPNLFPVNCNDVSHWKSSSLMAILTCSPSREVCWNKVKKRLPPVAVPCWRAAASVKTVENAYSKKQCWELKIRAIISMSKLLSVFSGLPTHQEQGAWAGAAGMPGFQGVVFVPGKYGTHQINYTVRVYSPHQQPGLWAWRKYVLLGTRGVSSLWMLI